MLFLVNLTTYVFNQFCLKNIVKIKRKYLLKELTFRAPLLKIKKQNAISMISKV